MDANHADVAQVEVMALLDERVEACRAKDINRLMPLYSPDIVYFDIIPPHRFIGADDVPGTSCGSFEYQGDIRLETRDLRVAVSGDVAFAHMFHPDSGTRRSGRDEVVWVRSTVCLASVQPGGRPPADRTVRSRRRPGPSPGLPPLE